ncbi:MAG: hypothetical protein L0Y71_09730 [Gemmataceae bacterium]|nr:hypothetical protein [Gemmataceae bacterium]
MMQAVDIETGRMITGDEARRAGRYLCPECRAIVGLRSGLRKIAHFAHFSTTRCALSAPESPRHRALKWLCRKLFAPLPVVWEAPLGERRVDALVNGQFAVECQASPLAAQEWRERTRHHWRLGYPVLWLWDVKRLCRRNTLAEALVLERNGRCVLAPPEIRLCHEESGGVIFVADKHEVLPCRLSAPESTGPAAATYGALATFLRRGALKCLNFDGDFDGQARSHFPGRSREFRLVRLGKPPQG